MILKIFQHRIFKIVVDYLLALACAACLSLSWQATTRNLAAVVIIFVLLSRILAAFSSGGFLFFAGASLATNLAARRVFVIDHGPAKFWSFLAAVAFLVSAAGLVGSTAGGVLGLFEGGFEKLRVFRMRRRFGERPPDA